MTKKLKYKKQIQRTKNYKYLYRQSLFNHESKIIEKITLIQEALPEEKNPNNIYLAIYPQKNLGPIEDGFIQFTMKSNLLLDI